MNPKLLTLNAPTIRNNRTLIWLQDQQSCLQEQSLQEQNSKWDAITTMSSYHKWPNANIVGMIATELNSMKVPIKVPLILMSQKVLSSNPEFLALDNIINLDSLEHYPFLDPWDGTDSDAVGIFALLCRYNYVVNCKTSRVKESTNTKPNETWLFTQFFKHKDKKRFLEIKECLARNCACPDIDRIVLINEKDYSSEYDSPKIHQVVTNKRLTYSDFLMYVYYSVPKNVYVVLCNADIYFEDLSDLHKINMENRMFGLLRWDVDTEGNSKIFGPRADSQDSWIFLSDSIQSKKWDFAKFNFQLGQAGCDNAFAGHILRNKFVLANPAISLKSYHLHNSNIRNYDKKDYIRSDVYINIVPTYIIDTKQETPTSTTMVSNETVGFEVKSLAMSDEITYCTMLEKEGKYVWEPFVENYYFDSIPIHKWNNSCVTPNGLVYDLYCIYTGKEDNYWENANVDILTPMQKCDKMFAIPFKNTDIFKNVDTYILNYISRYVRFLKLYPDISLWLPIEYVQHLEHFEWPCKLKAVYFDENTACWAKEVIGFLPGPHELGAEDIDSLREIYPLWTPVLQKKCSIVLGKTITQELAEKIAETLSKKSDFDIQFVYDSCDALIGSSLCIVMDNWSKIWALPKGSNVIEFQQELQIHGECQHLAHVAGFKSWVLLLSKGSVEDVQSQILEQLTQWLEISHF